MVDDRNEMDEISKKALKMYEFMNLDRLLRLNNYFKDSCEDTTARKKDPNLDKLCKNGILFNCDTVKIDTLVWFDNVDFFLLDLFFEFFFFPIKLKYILIFIYILI